ncbi:ATP-binding cassette sub- D member 3 [Chamberlinius hualienensis]
MAPVLSKLKSQNLAIGALSVGVLYWLIRQRNGTKKSIKPKVEEVSVLTGQKVEKKDRAQLDKVFFRKLRVILKIIIPRWACFETMYMALVAFCLLIRTYADMWMINNGTSIERAIIGHNRSQFLKHLGAFILAMPVISSINNVLKYGINELKLRFRYRLSAYLLDQYMSELTYYKMSNLDNRISNADQLLTQDVEKFSDSFAEVYSSLAKPILDIMIYVSKLSTSLGALGPISLISYLMFAGFILSRIRRPIGHLTVTEQRLEGEFRFVNSRIIVNSEEIAFYRGSKREKVTLDNSFRQLIRHLRKSVQFKFALGMFESIIAKYVATVVGYLAISRPFLNPNHRYSKLSHNERLEDYYRSGRMLIKLSGAIGRLVLAGRELTRLAGFTHRVSQLMNVLAELKKGKFERTMVSDISKLKSNANGINGSATVSKSNLAPGRGRMIFQDNVIRFEKLPLVTPNGDVLINELNFEVRSGMNVLVCGPNGCGKSSLFRVLGELWPLYGGMLTKPLPQKLFYIPQRPYMTIGTLRDQIIYPDTVEDQIKKGISDADLLEYLDLVQLTYILDREGGWEAVQDWIDVLSGGEKQRIAMARLFYHKPQFAILDECTSAVSVDVEGSMYTYCRKVGITLFTVSHRKSLWAHHEYFLHMDGRGSYEFKKIDENTIEFGS